MNHDPEDNQTLTHEFEKTFSFRGKPLRPYSSVYQGAVYRLGEGQLLPKFEEVPYLVYMLLTKTPAQADTLREHKGISAFRTEALAWADKEKLANGKGWEELFALHQSIVDPVEKAEEIAPDTDGVPVSGNHAGKD